MTESFAIARFKARLAPPAPARAPPPPLPPEERAKLLMRAVTMVEIRGVAKQLGIPFGQAYRERRQLYERPLSVWVDIVTVASPWRSAQA